MSISMHLQRAYDNAYDAGLSGILKELGPDQMMTPQQVDSLRASLENVAKRKPSLRWRIPSILALLAAARTTGDTIFVSF